MDVSLVDLLWRQPHSRVAIATFTHLKAIAAEQKITIDGKVDNVDFPKAASLKITPQDIAGATLGPDNQFVAANGTAELLIKLTFKSAPDADISQRLSLKDSLDPAVNLPFTRNGTNAKVYEAKFKTTIGGDYKLTLQYNGQTHEQRVKVTGLPNLSDATITSEPKSEIMEYGTVTITLHLPHVTEDISNGLKLKTEKDSYLSFNMSNN